MIEILILYEINKKVLTMYGISREIKSEFSALLLPSYGTIKPALTRLEKSGCVVTQKMMSEGGRPSTFYSITNDGKTRLTELLLETPLENPIQFLPSARIKISCMEYLELSERKNLIKLLKTKAESISIEIKNLLAQENNGFYHKMVFENLLCEYKNFVSLLEGLDRASNN